jgi:large subunit ribosomal protein L17
MRHRKSGRKLGRTAAHRKALRRNLSRALVTYETIQTTDTKAKELRRWADKLITLGKRDTVHARRQAFALLQDRALVTKIFDDLAKREEIASRNGGYTTQVKLGNRAGDNAPITRISWIGATLENTEKLRYPAHILEMYETVDDGAEAEDAEE